MPTDACQFFYACKCCGERLRPRDGDCCVFCSFGDDPCPPKQAPADRVELDDAERQRHFGRDCRNGRAEAVGSGALAG